MRIISYYTFIHPLRLLGADEAKNIYKTKAKGSWVLVAENCLNKTLEPLKKDGKCVLTFEQSPQSYGVSDYRLKYWGKYNLSGLYQVLKNYPSLACGQFQRTKQIGSKVQISNPLQDLNKHGILFRFNGHPNHATGLELIVFEDARDWVKTTGIGMLAAGLLDKQLCDLSHEQNASFEYEIPAHGIIHQAYPQECCLPPASELFNLAA